MCSVARLTEKDWVDLKRTRERKGRGGWAVQLTTGLINLSLINRENMMSPTKQNIFDNR